MTGGGRWGGGGYPCDLFVLSYFYARDRLGRGVGWWGAPHPNPTHSLHKNRLKKIRGFTYRSIPPPYLSHNKQYKIEIKF